MTSATASEERVAIPPMAANSQKLSLVEKAGYSAGDCAANFVFMMMVLYQTNFYTDAFGLSAGAAAAMLLWPRVWDAIFDPIMGILTDRTRTRWGKFRPWVLWTSIPWAVCMVLAYTTPNGWSTAAMIAYAGITNTLLMTLYSANNMPYSALGGVMTGDLQERMKLNSYRFVAVQIAQFIVGGLTLPLVKKFADAAGGGRHGLQHGWQMVVMIWAALCLVLFLVTFLTTRERIKPVNEVKSSPLSDFRDLIRNRPWLALVIFTLFNFAMLTYRGAANYNYYHHFADKSSMFDVVSALGLTSSQAASQSGSGGGALEFLGYIVHGTRETAADSNVADVFNSIINMLGTATTIVMIILSNGFSKRFGKKTVIATGFALSALNAFAMFLLPPTATIWMLVITMTGSIVYAPTIAVAWAMYADAADYSEWQTGRRFTGIVFATIGFALKAGLGLGSAFFLYFMALFWNYDTSMPSAPNAIAGYHASVSLMVGLLFICGMVAILSCTLNKSTTLKMAADLADRRAKAAA